MISLTERLTVPQVFFNSKHIGGAEEVLAILAKWDEEIASSDPLSSCGDKTPLERYTRLIKSKPDPADERLAIPTEKPASAATPSKIDFSASRTSEVFKIDGKQYTTLEFTKCLIQRMPRASLSYWGTSFYNVFKGSTGVTALQKIFQLETRDEAVQLGMRLQRNHFLGHCCKDHAFEDNGNFYRLQPFQSPHVLNSFRVWTDQVVETPMQVIHRLGKLWSKLESQHLNEEGWVDHATIRDDDLYWRFEENVCEIQSISLKDMDDATKKAFVINIYNVMIKYAFVKVGIPETNANRASFFDDVSINVGGCIFSFNHLEHGILRANTRHPYQLSKPFGVTDSRKRLALKNLDCRIHFALNCGAKSCPPIKKFSAEAIDEELRLAAMAFCEADDNVAINEEKSQLTLSKILYWYSADFGKKDKLPEIVCQYLRGQEKKQKLEGLLKRGNISLKFFDYDWSSNDINFIVYEKGHLNDRARIPYSGATPPERYATSED